MKDEIKEILEFDFQSQGERIEINEYERDILKDYITDLQEELKYQKQVEQEYNEKHTKLMNRCKKVIEYNEQTIQDIKDFYRPTSDKIYSGDVIIEKAQININILNGDDTN